MMNFKKIPWEMPFVPEGAEIYMLPTNNVFLQEAKEVAEKYSLDLEHPTGAIIMKKDQLLGKGANGSLYHEKYGCKRKKLGIPSGEQYELCEGCSPKNHAEQTAIRDAQENKKNTKNADLFLWGHWWCCESCWKAMKKAGIKRVFLAEGADELFKKQ